MAKEITKNELKEIKQIAITQINSGVALNKLNIKGWKCGMYNMYTPIQEVEFKEIDNKNVVDSCDITLIITEKKEIVFRLFCENIHGTCEFIDISI